MVFISGFFTTKFLNLWVVLWILQRLLVFNASIKSIKNYINEPYLGKIQESCSTQLLLNNKSLLQKLEPARQELVLDLKEVSFAHVHLEGFVDDGEPCVVLYFSPFAVAVTYNS